MALIVFVSRGSCCASLLTAGAAFELMIFIVSVSHHSFQSCGDVVLWAMCRSWQAAHVFFEACALCTYCALSNLSIHIAHLLTISLCMSRLYIGGCILIE